MRQDQIVVILHWRRVQRWLGRFMLKTSHRSSASNERIRDRDYDGDLDLVCFKDSYGTVDSKLDIGLR